MEENNQITVNFDQKALSPLSGERALIGPLTLPPRQILTRTAS